MTPVRWAYFDTSVLVKRYVKEGGSSASRKLFQRYRFLSSALAPVEALSALSRRRTAGEITQRDFLAIRSRLHKDRDYWELVEVGPIVLSQAEELVQKQRLEPLMPCILRQLLRSKLHRASLFPSSLPISDSAMLPNRLLST